MQDELEQAKAARKYYELESAKKQLIIDTYKPQWSEEQLKLTSNLEAMNKYASWWVNAILEQYYQDFLFIDRVVLLILFCFCSNNW